MAKEGNTALGGPLWRELFSVSLYKRSQGRIARQVTFAALLIMLAIGVYAIEPLIAAPTAVRWGIVAGLLALGAWFSFRIVNYSPFADFLIAVEAEMSKVSWPSRSQLFSSSIVVIITMVGLAAILLLFDAFWQTLLQALKVLGP